MKVVYNSCLCTAEGKVEGKADAQKEIAAKLKATGADPKFISEITGMSVEEISVL